MCHLYMYMTISFKSSSNNLELNPLFCICSVSRINCTLISCTVISVSSASCADHSKPCADLPRNVLVVWLQAISFCFAGDVAEAVRHARAIRNQIRHAQSLDTAELYTYAKELRVPYDLLQKAVELGRLPVVNFAAGGLGKWQSWIPNLTCSNDAIKF